MIIDSMLDTDFYKLKMSSFLWQHEYGNRLARYEFCNRTDVKLGTIINVNELQEELDNLFRLRFHYSELMYLERYGFTREYLDAVSRSVPTKEAKFSLTTMDDKLRLMITGPWWIATLYETPCLAIINELYGKAINTGILPDLQKDTMLSKLSTKIQFLKMNKGIRFIEFGTRRRFSRELQDRIVYHLQDIDHGPMLGTSNVLLAKKYNLQAMGTMAHEIPMGFAAIATHNKVHQEIRHSTRLSQLDAIKDWTDFCPQTFWLTDTYGSDWLVDYASKTFFEKDLCGLRQDSGDPHAWLDKVHSVFGTKKSIMFSDGLTPPTIRNLYIAARDYGFHNNQINFGWGTNLTNDGGIRPLSIVIKLSSISVGDHWIDTCKLSDNIKKAFGSPSVVEWYKGTFAYNENHTINEECQY